MIVAQRGWKIILAAVFGGLVLGIVARLWMRWISTDPEFSWGGTLGIVIAFTIFATTQATIYVLRRRVISRRLTSVIRGVGTFFTLPIFTAAGAVMFPTVILASIAVWRKKIYTDVRIALLVISFVIPAIQIKGIGSDFGWNFVTLGRSLLFILIYSVVILLLKPTLTPYEGSDSKVELTKRFKLILIAVFTIFVVFNLLRVFVMSSD
jgi:phosphoglycerol transferase MdoB-like AlkP superfamily enzyme